MSILIPGIEMPTTCAECIFVQHNLNDEWCYIFEAMGIDDVVHRTGIVHRMGKEFLSTVPDWCPLIEIPAEEET